MRCVVCTSVSFSTRENVCVCVCVCVCVSVCVHFSHIKRIARSGTEDQEAVYACVA